MPERSVLRMGDRGPVVDSLQTLLRQRGFLSEPRPSFDIEVRRGVREFQARHVDQRGRPLVQDGVVGPLTWWALENPDNTAILLTPLPADSFEIPPVGGSARGRAALSVAVEEMRAGAKEMERNNDGPWVRKYLNRQLEPPVNWCAAFVSWCFDQHPAGIPFRYSLGARDIREQFRSRGWTYDAALDNPPQPGDIIVWWRGSLEGWMGHIGIVHSHQDGIVYTIEGNKGGFPAPVHRFDYVLGRIDKLLGFGRVP